MAQTVLGEALIKWKSDTKPAVKAFKEVSKAAKKTNKAFSRFSRSVKKKFVGLEKGVGKFSKATQKLRRVMAGLAIGGFFLLGKFIKDSVTAFKQQELAESRLNQVMTEVNKSTKTEIELLKKQASALQNVTLFGDEAIISGQAFLGTFQLTAKQIKELTPRLLDMAEGLRKTSGISIDLEQISALLGKTLSTGTLSALRRVGVTVDETQEEMFKLAEKEERVAILAKVVDSNFKGLAKAAGATATGQLVQMKNAFGDIQEVVGQKVLKAINELVKRMQEWLQDPENVERIKEITNNVINLVERGLKKLINWIIKLVDWWKNLSPALKSIIKWVGLITIGFVQLAPVLHGAIKGMIGFAKAAKWLTTTTAGGVTLGLTAIVIALIAIINNASKISKSFKEMKEFGKSAVDELTGFESAQITFEKINVGLERFLGFEGRARAFGETGRKVAENWADFSTEIDKMADGWGINQKKFNQMWGEIQEEIGEPIDASNWDIYAEKVKERMGELVEEGKVIGIKFAQAIAKGLEDPKSKKTVKEIAKEFQAGLGRALAEEEKLQAVIVRAEAIGIGKAMIEGAKLGLTDSEMLKSLKEAGQIPTKTALMPWLKAKVKAKQEGQALSTQVANGIKMPDAIANIKAAGGEVTTSLIQKFIEKNPEAARQGLGWIKKYASGIKNKDEKAKLLAAVKRLTPPKKTAETQGKTYGGNWLSGLGSKLGSAGSYISGIIEGWMGGGGGGGGSKADQFGGRVRPGEDVVVGEKGLEIFRPDTRGSIIPNNRLSNLKPAGAGVRGDQFTFIFKDPIVQSEEDARQLIERGLDEVQKRAKLGRRK